MYRKRLVMLPLLLLSFCANAKVIFFSGFETRTVNNDRTSTTEDSWGMGETTEEKYPESFEVVRKGEMGAPAARAGNYMARFEVREGWLGIGGNYRNQLEQYFIKVGHEYWIGYSLYLPSRNWANRTDMAALAGGGTEAPNPSGWCDNSARMGLYYKDKPPVGRQLLVGNWKRFPFDQYTDKWLDVVIHLDTSNNNGNDPFFEFWLNGDYKGRHNNSIQDSESMDCPVGWQMNYKIGLYASPTSSSVPAVAYFDEFRAGDKNSNYSEVAPGQGSAPLVFPPSVPANVRVKEQ